MRKGCLMLSDAEYILNVNPERFPDTLDVEYKERSQSRKISRCGLGVTCRKLLLINERRSLPIK